MYSDMSRDPTAMTFRLPDGETLESNREKQYIRDLKYPRLKNDIPGVASYIKKYINKSSINKIEILVDSAVVKFQVRVWASSTLWCIVKQRDSDNLHTYCAVLHDFAKTVMILV